MYPTAKLLSQADALVVPMPVVHGEPLTDTALIEWVENLLTAIFPLDAESEGAPPRA